jgi:hypothetical protein
MRQTMSPHPTVAALAANLPERVSFRQRCMKLPDCGAIVDSPFDLTRRIVDEHYTHCWSHDAGWSFA